MLSTGNCDFGPERHSAQVLTRLDLPNPLIISVDPPKRKKKKVICGYWGKPKLHYSKDRTI